MADELKVQYTLTAPVRISMPQVFEPRIPDFGGVLGKPTYSARFVFPADHPDLVPLKQLAGKILRLLEPDGNFTDPNSDIPLLRPQRMVNGKVKGDFWYAFKTGDELAREAKERATKKGVEYKGYEDWMAGTVTMNAKTGAAYPPQLDIAINGGWRKADPAVHKTMFFNGMEAYGSFTLAGSANPKGEFGVSAYLNGLGATGRGEKIGGGGGQPIVYPTVKGIVTSENPLDDEIPF